MDESDPTWLRSLPYSAYLKTDHWQSTRSHALQRAEYRCQVCNTAGATLDVHHRTYERLGEELPSDLTVLCRTCHERYHKFDEIIEQEREDAIGLYEYIDEQTHCFDFDGVGVCERCGGLARYNYGTDQEPQLACELRCFQLLCYESFAAKYVGETPHIQCENCHSHSAFKFRYALWGYEDEIEEHFVCGTQCMDALTRRLDWTSLKETYRLDSGQFTGTAVENVPDWYLDSVADSVPSNGSKIRRLCDFELQRRHNGKTRGRQAASGS